MAPKKRPSMLQRQRQLLKQRNQVKKAGSTQLPPKGGTSAGSPKAGAQRLATAVKQKVQQDVTVTRALADNMRRNNERDARQIKPDPSPKVRYSGSGGPNPKPRNLPPVTKPVKGGSSGVTSGSSAAKATPPNTIRAPQTKGKPIPNTIKQNRPAPRGGALDKAGPTVDVKAKGNPVTDPWKGSATRPASSSQSTGSGGRTLKAGPAPRSGQKPDGPIGPRTKPSGDSANWLKSRSPEAAAARAVAPTKALKAAKLAGRGALLADLAITAKSVFNPKDNIITRAKDLGTAIENTQAKPGQKKEYVSQNDTAKKANAKIQADNTKNKPRTAEYKRPKANVSKPSAARSATQKRDYKKLKDFG
jgi:hypothetical protein